MRTPSGQCIWHMYQFVACFKSAAGTCMCTFAPDASWIDVSKAQRVPGSSSVVRRKSDCNDKINGNTNVALNTAYQPTHWCVCVTLCDCVCVWICSPLPILLLHNEGHLALRHELLPLVALLLVVRDCLVLCFEVLVPLVVLLLYFCWWCRVVWFFL